MAPHTFEALSHRLSHDLAADPLAALRDATREQHAALDAGLPIAQPGATLTDYAAHAAALSAWLCALAPELDALKARESRYIPDTAAHLQALQSDLRDAGDSDALLRAPQASLATEREVRHALALAPGHADAVRWGLAYVVEGAQLGGQVMHRQLAPRLAPHPLRYLQGRGSGTGAHWKSFLSLLRSHLSNPQDIAAACHGAQAAFTGLAQHLHAEGVST